MTATKSGLMEDMKRINIGVEAELNKVMTALGLTASQGHVLIYILDHLETELSSTQIHQQMAVSRATVSGLLKKLRHKGYLEFQTCADDDRKKLIVTTEKGLKLRKTLRLQIEQAAEMIYTDFSANDLKTMNRFQEKILANLRHKDRLRKQGGIQ